MAMENARQDVPRDDTRSTSTISPPAGSRSRPRQPGRDPGSAFAFWLVIAMLIALFVLLGMLLLVPTFQELDDRKMDFYKSTVGILLGAFGAWIGAGAAHFFGRENLKESSMSTERALSVQGEVLRRKPRFERIRDLTLTVMNNEFMFPPDAAKKTIADRLRDNANYWFVPELDGTQRGILQDVIHARVFWDDRFADDMKLSAILAQIDRDGRLEDLRSHHGDAFYMTATPNDEIAVVASRMTQRKVEVGIVVDGEGRPTHCFTQRELRALLDAQP